MSQDILTPLTQGETNGVFSGNELSNDAYHSNRSHLSSSGLKKLLHSPSEFKSVYIDGFASPPSDAMVIGTYVHGLILEPEKVPSEFAIFPGPRRAGADWLQFAAAHKGKTIVTLQQHELALKMQKGFLASRHAPNLIQGGKAEDSYFTVIDGVPVKVRLDYFTSDGKIVDLKTTSRPLEEDELAQAIKKYGYHISAALYVDVLKRFTGKEHPFYFVFVTKDGDCECRTYKASQQLIEKGRRDYRKALEIYKRCKSTNTWTNGEPDEIPEIDMADW